MKEELANKIRVGIIGVGKMGELHLSKYLQMPEVEVVGVYDIAESKLCAVHEKFGVPVFTELSDLLFEVDAVSIASHTDAHFKNCKTALESGTHVLVEKPMCGNPKEARELVELAEKNQLTLQVGYLERFRLKRLTEYLPNPDVQFVDVHWLATDLPRESSIDVIADLLVHPLDMVLSLIPHEPKSFSVVGAKMLTNLLDMVSVRLEFQNGAIANLWISRASSHRERRLYLFSDKEQAAINFITNHIEVLRANSGKLEKISVDLTKTSTTPDVLMEQCQSFVECVKGGLPPLVSGAQGLKVLELAEKIRTKMHVQVEPIVTSMRMREFEHGL